jgi:superfamily II DNA or RNA helicase
MLIRTLDAPAGSGKTRACAHHADRLARLGHKVLFVQPTKHLITKTIADELQPLAPAYPVIALHSGTVAPTASVIAAIVAHFQNAERDRGEVLFVTHAAFMLIPYIERKADWVLIMDEVPQVDVFEELKLPETHHLLTPLLTLVPGGAAYGRLVTIEDALTAQEDAR